MYWRHGPVAQWIEQFRPKEKVAGSTLARVTNLYSHICGILILVVFTFLAWYGRAFR